MQKNFRVVFFFPTARKGIDCSLPWESQPLSTDLLKISNEMIRNPIRNIFFFLPLQEIWIINRMVTKRKVRADR